LAGLADLEDALKKLDRLTQEEARMAHAEVLRITHSIRDEVKIVDSKVERVEDKVEDVGDKVEDVDDKVEEVGDKVEGVGDKVEEVGDKVQCVDDKVQVVIDGAQGLSSQCLKHFNTYTFRRQANKRSGTGNKIGHSTGGQRHGRNQVFVISYLRHC
jgi:archaellum component FlaC